MASALRLAASMWKAEMRLLKPGYWHYALTGILGIAVVPCLRRLHLPLSFDWVTLSIAYWIVLAAQSIFVAAVLWSLGSSGDSVLGPLINRYRREPLRTVLALAYAVILAWSLTWMKALVLTVDTVATIEYLERGRVRSLRQAGGKILLPAFYLFAGFLLVLAYNSVIVSVRFNFSYDPMFNAVDQWILRGWSVSDLSHWAIESFPLPFFRFLEFVYFGMFPQIGAGVILVSLYQGKSRGLQFVGTILMAYYLALGVFYLWPSHGPYYLCPGHFSRFPNTLQAYSIQQILIAHALALWNHVPIHRLATDYFIAFPCMHIAQPVIVMWFLRRWKRMVLALCVYDALLTGSILLLEWHYLVDIIAGLLVAAIAIAITDSYPSRGRIRAGSEMPVGEGAFSSG
jgi:hypothetical protein